ERRRKRIDRDLPSLEQFANLAKRGEERLDQRPLGLLPDRGGRFREAHELAREAPRLRRGRAFQAVRGRGGEFARRLHDRRQRFGRGRRGIDRGIERILEEEARVVDDRELLLLVL